MKHITLLMIGWVILGFAMQAQVNNPWIVPDDYREMLNPAAYDQASMKMAEGLYAKHCEACHGATGMGDGERSGELVVDPSDLTLVDLDVQTDGELYYKIMTGRDEMPAYKKVLSEEEMWLLVNYIRKFYQED